MDRELIKALWTGGGATLVGVILTLLFTTRKGKTETELALRRLEMEEDSQRSKEEAALRDEERKFRDYIAETYKGELIVCQQQRDLLRAENDRLRSEIEELRQSKPVHRSPPGAGKSEKEK